LLTYTQNLGIWTKDYTGFTPAPFVNLNHFWSLAVEEQFYFAWPLIVFLVRDLRKLLFVALGLSLGALILRIVLESYGAVPGTLYELTPCRMDALLLGGSLALLLRSRFRPIVLRYSVPAFVVLLGGLIWLAYPLRGLLWNAPLVQTLGYTLTALTSTALIAVTLLRRTWARIAFENRVMRFLGKYSYGLYVFHYSIDMAITASLRRWLLATFHSKAIAVILASLPVVLATILVAFASYHLYEKRFLRLKRYFEPKRRVAMSGRSPSVARR
jgi:peptidoglycan/LPS O-acetylase OafA/YrhL